ncbi:MAG: hypothetical protein CMP91_07220 [Gammaproteobacteria bacterium]|nr:hypothetical protein [Gammaproteobacteria bacterium]MAY03083.1 hypothetical protein [Gammaproteobacteria bacterium]|tara:strand:- start:1177 stop:1407 length:231 start_codon:yes stop_codon:yes gene_type:complete
MKLNEAIEWGRAGRWQDAQVRVSPSNREQWFVMLRDTLQKSFILVDNDDSPIVTADANELLSVIRSLGLKEVTFFL